MKMVVGLGNPGPEYRGTRHNLGFEVLEELARRHRVRRQEQRDQALVAWLELDGEQVVLVKPLTYMNLSGNAVRALQKRHGLSLQHLLVVCDDLDLPLGRLRLRQSGGAGGHRGLASVISALGSNEFSRLRVGVGRPPGREEVVDYVLGRFAPEERETAAAAVRRAADAVETWLRCGIEEAMNAFN